MAVKKKPTTRRPAEMGETRPRGLRFEVELIERVDAHAERMRRASPGQKATRSDAFRALVTKGLEVVEAERKAR